MREELLQWLRCPQCHCLLLLRDAKEKDGQVWQGTLACDCSAVYPVVDSVPRFVSTDKYAENFSFEWNLHSKTQLDTPTRQLSRNVFIEKTGFDLEQFKGKLVLDVGVGAGRYAEVVSHAGATVVGIDLSYAVDAAQRNLGGRENVHIVQADLFGMPFAPQTFDCIYSIGVLHHTPDCRSAFHQLPPLLKPGGEVAIWVYSAHLHPPGSVRETVNRLWRALTIRLPKRLLYALCCLLTPAYLCKRIPHYRLLSQLIHMLLPGMLYHLWPALNNHKDYKQWLLDNFDWYSPTYQSKHTYPEVAGWFREAGLTDLRLMERQVGVAGKKPPSDHNHAASSRASHAQSPLSQNGVLMERRT